MLKIEYLADGSFKWRPWVYYRDDQKPEATLALARFNNLYRSSRWMFRLVPADDSDRRALRKMIRLQNVLY